jgi:cytochrome c553
VVPLCRRCHRAYDRGELDLLPRLEPRFRAELAHALTHRPLIAVLRRVTGARWAQQ